MDFKELLVSRYSVRAYKNTPVEQEKLAAILDAARMAPTAANRQPFRIYVIDVEKHKNTLQQLYSRDWFVQAPLVLAIAAVQEEAWTRRFDEKNYAVVDATIAFDHLILQAADLGLGTCWIAAFDPDVARQLLDLPENWLPVAFTPLGYPADDWRQKKRKDIEHLVSFV